MLDGCHSEAVRDFLKLAKVHPNKPDVELLGKLTRSFLRFPYENLTKIIRVYEESDPLKRLRMPEIVLGDHLDNGTGGTCFSLTYFFKSVLEQCGFECTPLLCDRSYGPDTHCALAVVAEGGRYLVDPGYLIQHPLAIPDRASSMFHTLTSSVELKRIGDTSQYLLITHVGGRPTIRYRLKNVPVDEPSFRDRWIDSFSWAQMRHLCITQLTDEGRIYMRDAHLRYLTSERRSQIKVKNNYDRVIAETFGMNARLIERARECIR